MKSINGDNERVKVFSSFIKKGKHIFRHSTYLQFGENEKIIGACVLSNPGSASLKDEKKFKELVDGEEVVGQGNLDPTMKQLVKIIEKTHGVNVSGRFYIYNIFTLRNSGINEANNYYKKLSRDCEFETLLHLDFEDFKENINKIPWVLLGWGCSGTKALSEKKEEWNEYITERNVKIVGVRSIQNPVLYKHPCPPTKKPMEEIESELVKQINVLLDK